MSYKILAVDDEAEILALIEKILEREGYDVLTTTSPLAVLEILNENEIALVFMDIKMPEMDGIETLKKLKEIKPALNVILITAYRDADKVVQTFRLGAYDCIFKPFDFKYPKTAIIAKFLE